MQWNVLWWILNFNHQWWISQSFWAVAISHHLLAGVTAIGALSWSSSGLVLALNEVSIINWSCILMSILYRRIPRNKFVIFCSADKLSHADFNLIGIIPHFNTIIIHSLLIPIIPSLYLIRSTAIHLLSILISHSTTLHSLISHHVHSSSNHPSFMSPIVVIQITYHICMSHLPIVKHYLIIEIVECV